MDLNQAKAYAEFFQSVVTSVGIIVGGIWVYYKFVKGRLFSPKIELSLSGTVVRADSEQILITFEVILRNIGSVRLLPTSCHLDVRGFSISNGSLDEHIIPVPDGDNILPFKSKPQGAYYIDPGECSSRSRHFVVHSNHVALSVIVHAIYNRSATERTFYIDLTKRETAQAPTTHL